MMKINFERLQEVLENDEFNGFCLNCGEEQFGGVEPDARNYKCDSCGERQVFGAQEILMMGYFV